jgi:hypothetical protein
MGSSTLSSTERQGSRAGFWNIIVMSRRGRVTRSPDTRTSPALTGSSPEINRSSVDLPQPDRPSTATNSPSAISRSMPRSASTVPERPVNVRETPVRRIIFGAPDSFGSMALPL